MNFQRMVIATFNAAVKKARQSQGLPPAPAAVWQDPWYFLAFGCGLGTAWLAPGTVGTLLGIPVVLVLQQFSVTVYAVALVVLILAAMAICEKVSQGLKIHDHPGIVLDEVVGYVLTLWGIPKGMIWLVLGFILFRFFDIKKIGPVAWVNRYISGGFGIVLDDIWAAIPAWIILHILVFIFG